MSEREGNVTYALFRDESVGGETFPRGMHTATICPDDWEAFWRLQHRTEQQPTQDTGKQVAMANPQDYVTDQARYAEQAQDMSGVRGPAAGMAPYPLYGLGQPEASVALWKRPWFCWVGGTAIGFGAAYAFFGWFKPKYMKRNTRKKKSEE